MLPLTMVAPVPNPALARSRYPAPLYFDNNNSIPNSALSPVQNPAASPNMVDKDHHVLSPMTNNGYHHDVEPPSPFESEHTSSRTNDMFDKNTSNGSSNVYSSTHRSDANHSDFTGPQRALSPVNGHGRSAGTASRDNDEIPGRYVSDSPSPIDNTNSNTHTPSFPHPLSAPHSQGHFSNTNSPGAAFASEMNRDTSLHDSDRYVRNGTHGVDKYSIPSSLLDQRRMSEPSIFGSSGSTQSSAYPNPATEASSGRYHQMQFAFNPPPQSPTSPGYPSSLHRGGSIGSIRDRQPSPPWKTEDDMQLPLHPYSSLDEPISPLNPNFSGGAHSPTLGLSSHGYPNIADDSYGPSPPGTGTSTTSSNTPGNRGPGREGANGKTYSFVALPGNAVKKRPRRRYDEIERLYQCSWPDCSKAYGTLNHLNAHVTMQKHGSKRSPTEFKELRKQWRKAKKEEEVIRTHHAANAHIYHGSRRSSHDPDFYYPHHRHASHHHPYHSSHHSTHLPTIGPDGRYASVALDSIRYPPADELDGLPRGHGAEDAFRRGSHPDLRAQARYHSGAAHGSWHPSMGSSRQAHYLASGRSSQMGVSAGLPANADISLNRLGPDSTLLTPLPGYEPPSLAQVESDLNIYGGYANGHYTDDGSRPGTGHHSLYEDGRPGTGHGSLYGDDRPSTGQSSLYDDRPGTGHGSLYGDDRPGTGHRSLYDEGRPSTGHGSDRGADFRHL